MSKCDTIAKLRNYIRRKVELYGKNDLFQADLIDLILYLRENHAYNYILCVIDYFTKFAWAIALKSKKDVEITEAAMNKIIAYRCPKLLQVDPGQKFYNLNFNLMMWKCGAKMYAQMLRCVQHDEGVYYGKIQRNIKGDHVQTVPRDGFTWLVIDFIRLDEYIQ